MDIWPLTGNGLATASQASCIVPVKLTSLVGNEARFNLTALKKWKLEQFHLINSAIVLFCKL